MGLAPTSPAFWGGGLPGNSAEFNGTNQRLQGAGVANFNNGNPNLFSYELWVKRTADNGTARRIFDIYNAGFSLYFMGNENNTGGPPTTFDTIRHCIVTNGGANIKNDREDTLLLSTWKHYIVTFDHTSGVPASRVHFVYKDGVDQTFNTNPPWSGTGANNTTQTGGDSNRTINIGCDSGLGVFWNGRVYQLAFWSGVFLSASAVLELFQNPRRDRRNNFGNYSSAASLSHYWMPALDSTNLGKDYGNHAVLHDLTNTNGVPLVADAP